MIQIPLQKKLKYLGDFSCYLLCLCKQFGQEDKILELYDYFLNKGYIDETCYVKDPVKIVKYLSGNNYKVERLEKLPIKYDFAVLHYYNKNTGLGHFVLKDWDPLGNSNTRLNGVIESYRVFTKIN